MVKENDQDVTVDSLPTDKFLVRHLQHDDWKYRYNALLSQLTTSPDLDPAVFERRFCEMFHSGCNNRSGCSQSGVGTYPPASSSSSLTSTSSTSTTAVKSERLAKYPVLADKNANRNANPVPQSFPSSVILVIFDKTINQIVATATVLFERKFSRNAGICAHIEDVVVDARYRGQKLGQALIIELVEICKELGCYKVILDCSESNVPFYEKCGFQKKELQMAKYLS
mmetsp:Transcript_18352/g.31805  ORF Transcript_18352/g.31805 Transcript_18352/m.31805 type:complete len:226 (-) Transcript_18352:49-726(-)